MLIKEQGKKLGLICLVLVIAIGSIGLAYAMWSQNFNFTGTVNTGTYLVGIDTSTLSTTGSSGLTTCTISSTPVPSSSAFTVNISNAYPGWSGNVIYTIKNTGTIPAKVTGITLSGAGGTIVSGSGPWNLRFSGGSTTDVTVSSTGVSTTATIAAGTGSVTGIMTISVPGTLAISEAGLNGYFTFTIVTQQNP
jgi:hypothetical protein